MLEDKLCHLIESTSALVMTYKFITQETINGYINPSSNLINLLDSEKDN